jgi:hypothetical protein
MQRFFSFGQVHQHQACVHEIESCFRRSVLHNIVQPQFEVEACSGKKSRFNV